MKYILLALVLIVLTACDSSSDINAARAQYQAASANLSAAIAQQAAIDKATVQAKMAATEAVMATQGAQDAAVKQLQIEASATMSAIDIRAQQDDLLNRQALATRIANDYNLQATQEWQSAQATSTVIALDVANRMAKNQRVQANADFWSTFLPDLARIILAALIVLVIVFVWWIGRRAYHDDQRNKQEAKHEAEKNRFFFVGGIAFYLPEPTDEDPYPYPVQVHQLPRQWLLPQPGDAEQILDQVEEPKEQPQIVDRGAGQFLAGLLLRWSAKSNGWDSQNLLGYRDVPDFSGRKWSKAIEYIRSIGVDVETTTGDGSHLARETIQQVYNKISISPTPTKSNGNGQAEH